MSKVKAPTNFDAVQSLNFIWSKLHYFVPSYFEGKDQWDDINTAMAWIEDECGLERIEGILEYKQPVEGEAK